MTQVSDERAEYIGELEVSDKTETMDESLESKSEKRNTVEEIKSIEKIKSACKVTRCTNEIPDSTHGISASGNKSTENFYNPLKKTGEVNKLDNFQVERSNERKEVIMKNIDEAVQIHHKPTVSNVKNQEKMTNVNDEERESAIVMERTPGISNEYEQGKVLGSKTSNAFENLNKTLCEQKKEDADEVKIYNTTSHTISLVEENLKHSHGSEKGKEDMAFLGEAQISIKVGNDIQRSEKVLRKADVPAVDENSHEYMKRNRNDSKRLEKKQYDSISRTISDTNTGDIRKNTEINSERSIECKKIDEKGKRRYTHPTKRRSSHSSMDFDRDVADSPGHCKRESRFSSGHKSSSHRFKDDNVSNSKDHGTDVAHFSGWHKNEHYDVQKHRTPNRYCYEEDICTRKSWAFKERSYERKSSNQRYHKKETEISSYWSDIDSNSSWDEHRDGEKKDKYMSNYIDKKKLKIQENEGDTEGENRSLLSNLIHRSGMMINEDVRKKFAKACVSFLKSIRVNQVPSCSRENYANDWYSDEDAEPQHSQERIYSQRARKDSHEKDAERQHDQDWPSSPKFSYYSDEWCTDQNSGDSSKSRSFDSRRHHREHDASCSTTYSRRHRLKNEVDAERQYGQGRSCSPKLGSSSDFWYTDQNSRNFSRNRSYCFGRHHREPDASYSTSHSRKRSISGAERQHGHNRSCSPERDYNPDEWYTDQNSGGSSRNRHYNSWRHHKEHDASHSASHSQRHGHASSIIDDDEKMEDQISIYRHSSEKIRKQCERERDPATRRALLSLFDAHDHECSHYLKQPDAHPDYNKEYRLFFQNKTKSILELGGDPNTFNFYCEWKKYWPSRMNELFRENWKTKMQLCTSFLAQKNNSSSSECSTDLDSSTSSTSSDDSTDSSTREKVHSYSKKKKKLRYSKSKASSAKGKWKQEKKLWKPINEVEVDTDDRTLKLDIKRYRERSENPSIDKCKLNKQEVNADDIALELDIKRYRERSESHSVDKSKIDKQASFSPLQNQNNQGSMAIQVVDVMKLLHYMKERFDELEEPLDSLYLKAVNMKEKNLNPNEILKEEDCCSILLKLGEKLEKMLEDENLSVIQKVITREAHERFSHLLLRIKEKKSQHMGLDISSIARITMGKEEGKALTFIKNALLYQGHPYVSNEKLINIYSEVKEEHKNLEYLSSAQTLVSHQNNVFSVSQDESNPNYVEPSKPCQSEGQPHIQPSSVYTQPVISSVQPNSHSSTNDPLDAASVMLDSIENSTRILKPASLLQSSTSSRKKTLSLVPSADSKTKVDTPPHELKKASSVVKSRPTEISSPSASHLVTSPALSIKTDLSAPTVLVSQIEVTPSTSKTITTVSECESVSDSKLYQNTIKDCFTSPSSSPKEERPSFSLQDCAKLDFENPEYFSIPFSGSLGTSPFESSVNTEKLWDRSSNEIILSASDSKTKMDTLLECHADSISPKDLDESGSNVKRYEEPSTGVSKKPIRITIPQLSKQKTFIDSVP